MEEITNILQFAIEATSNKLLRWKRDDEPLCVFTSFGDDEYSFRLEELEGGGRIFVCEEDRRKIFVESCCGKKQEELLNTLRDTIVSVYPILARPVRVSVSLTKIKERLCMGMRPKINDTSSFDYLKQTNPYVHPNFSLQSTSNGLTALGECQVIAISAPGCTGKTELTKYLSSEMKMPVFDLNKNDEVASNSLLGMFFKTMDFDIASEYVQSLRKGRTTMIIDALDEGYIKTNHGAFESFLDGVVDIAKDNIGVPFVMMGRTSILELSVMYLEEHGVKVSMLQIEPFVKKTAEEFIDVHISQKKGRDFIYNSEYRATRNEILKNLEAFFNVESEISKRQSERFIGYAPVLVSIVELLEGERNLLSLKNELIRSNAKNVQLVRNIVEFILNREHDKIKENVRQLLEKLHYKEVNDAVEKAYNIDEQCARILCKVAGVQYKDTLTPDDPVINEEYEKHAKSWFDMHPFVVNQEIQNIVFEAYVVSKLIETAKYKETVITYLDLKWRNSYILFDLYDIMAGKNRKIDRRFVKYLIDSYKATEKGTNRHLVELTADDNCIGTGTTLCELNFESLGSREYEPYVIMVSNEESIDLPRVLSNIYIDAPISLVLHKKMSELSPALSICCRKLSVPSEGLLLTRLHGNDAIVIECDEFEGNMFNGKPQVISNKGNLIFSILTDDNLFHPFAAYRKPRRGNLVADEALTEKYQKMRRTIIQFRSHSKGALAKYKEKIDNRIGNTPLGKDVIKALQRNNILEEKGHMYVINDEIMSDKLGLSYNELRTYEMNEKTKTFLNSI